MDGGLFPQVTRMKDLIHAVAKPVQGWLVQFYAVFGEAEVAIFVSVALLTAALLVFLWFRFVSMAPYFRAIARVTTRIESTHGKSGLSSEFQSIDDAFRREAKLRHAWSEFDETLIKPEIDELQVVRNTSRPAAYFNTQSAVEAGLPLPFFQSASNYFVGLGLLFTFLGLVAALHFASSAVEANASVEHAKDALHKLLLVASFKFLTSIAGITSSLGLSFGIKHQIHRLQVSFERLCIALEERLDFVTPEFIALQHLREQKSQTKQLERFNTDFAIQLADAIEKKLNSSLGTVMTQALAPLHKTLENMSSGIGSANQEALQRMLSDFTGNLHQSTGKELESLATELRKIQETIQATTSGVSQSGSQFGQRLEAAATKLESMLSSSATSMQQGLSEAVSKMQTLLAETAESMKATALKASVGSGVAIEKAGGMLAEHVNSAAAQLTASLQPAVSALGGMEGLLHQLHGRMQSQTSEFNSSVDSMRDLLRQMDSVAIRLRDAATPVASSAERLSTAASATEKASHAISDSHRQIQGLLKGLEEAVKNNAQIWEEHRVRFERTDASLAAVIRELLDGAENFRDQVTKFVTEIDEHFASSVRHLAGGVERLADVSDSLEESLSKAAAAISEA